MTTHAIGAGVLVWAACGVASAEPRGVAIVEEGRSAWRILVGERAGRPEQFAAEELQRYIERMSGAKLAIVRGAAGDRVIRVGVRGATGEALALPVPRKGYDGYAVSVGERSVVIAGDNERGVVYGAYDVLERLGCRWCYPQQDPNDGEVVPRRMSLVLSAGAWSVASPMRFRICNGSAWFFDMDLDAAAKQLDWGMKNRYNTMGWQSESQTTLIAQYERMKQAGLLDALDRRGMLLHGPGHSFDHFLRAEDHMAQHPEWFGLRDGKRSPQNFFGAQFCWSNAEARKQFVENVVAFVQACPRISILMILSFDGGRCCECAECRTAGASNLLMRLMSEVITRLETVRPDLLVETVGGYEPMTEPPTGVAIHPKQRIVWAHWGRYYDGGYGDPQYGRRENLEKWVGAAKGGMTICQYYADNFAEPWILPPFLVSLEADRKYFLDRGIESVYMLMWPPGYWWNHGLNGYIAGRCFYDASLDPWKELQDYAVAYYGEKAGPLIGRYYEQWARHVDLAYRVKGGARDGERAMLAEQRRTLIDPAVEAAKGDAVAAYRVSKVARLHTLAEKLAEGQRRRDEVARLREARSFAEAETKLAEARACADDILEYFHELADLKQGLIEKNEIPSFITMGVKGWTDEEAKALAAAREDARLDSVEPAFVNPIGEGSDPWVIRHGDHYYYCESEGDEGVSVWKSDRLTDRGTKRVVWERPKTGWNCRQVWAPELHRLGGRWYIYYAASDGRNENHRAGVLEAVGDDPQGEFADKGMLYTGDDIAGRSNNRWAIDVTPLEIDGRLYAIWSGWPGTDDVQYLYIAPMSNPWTIAGNRVRLCENDTYAWERVAESLSQRGLHEGPQVLRHDGRVFVVYSCSGSWEPSYKLGLLDLKPGADPLAPKNWTKHAKPVMQSEDRVFGIGHASFTKSPDGTQDWILYHTKLSPAHGWQRAVHIQPFAWTKDGLPDFGGPAQPGRQLAAPSGEQADSAGETFRDDFNAGHWDRWTYYGYRRFIWADRGVLHLGGRPLWGVVNDYRCGEKALVRGFEWGDVTVKVRVRVEEGGRDAGVLFRVRRPSIGYDAQRGYFAGIIPQSRKVVLGRTDGASWRELALADCPVADRQWYALRVEAAGDQIRVFVDDQLRITAKDGRYARGRVGLRVVDSHAMFDDFCVQPPDHGEKR